MKSASDSPQFSYVELTLIISKILDYKILLVLKDLFIKKPKNISSKYNLNLLNFKYCFIKIRNEIKFILGRF
ncbi:hypothetical protein LEP1GSC035_3605 [Leptospira noguchii str. 2007001578]|uniref:Uncharacterized protein n=1 Tax=Leptospira noguchii str. 2007001578 TaxID=1049974 RepID=A0ABP2T6L5_9LEPT|nr:hypothetical protein LEP1GSC035_3605 [Leptospira noguchii str. 2007001578]